jgi:Methyltransferase domain
MKVDIRTFLGSIPAVKALAARVGLPDEPMLVEMANPQAFAECLDAAMHAFEKQRQGTQTLIDADVTADAKGVWIRILQNGPHRKPDSRVEKPLAASFDSLRNMTETNGGQLHYHGGSNHFDLQVPCSGVARKAYIEVDHLPWSERYGLLLERESWGLLGHMAFRFSDLATMAADRCLACQMTNVLIPSVGICIHPWLFACRGLTVTATDCANTALAALSEPHLQPRLYSSAAYERWDISDCGSYATIPQPNHFDGMPALEHEHIREELRRRISFKVADWACLPLPDESVDFVFATNALPRNSDAEILGVLNEWIRVLRPGGVAFIAQHNPTAGLDVGSFFLAREFGGVDFVNGEAPTKRKRGGFQILCSSG